MNNKQHPIVGIKIGTTCAGLKSTNDLVIFELEPESTCAGVFTQNAFCAAPVIIAKQHLATANPRFLLINSGNANAGRGKLGLQDAITCCETVGCDVNEVLPFSTGVIGEPLPTDKICAAIPNALKNMTKDGWEAAASAIRTTDTVNKIVSIQTSIGKKLVTITGIAKGAGMIRPNMATMLAFIATDADVPADILQSCLNQAVEQSFNRITIDGDTSTNDACMLIATGCGQQTINNIESLHYKQFCQAVTDVCSQLALAIVRDGEGATKFITISVEQGDSSKECLEVAYTIAHSPLVKTAFFASDANWGRILAAVGRAEVADFDIDAVTIYLNEVCIVKNGGAADTYTEELGSHVMQETDISVRILLGRGKQQEKVFTCDLSHDYVRINAEYRT
ncbi:bifunctional glutamate N-acetyltransferase/amino-acid acetyltransferase ArgJ [Candidatus Halobeggiatoa sp. HSG11]|nr:bifunctional glutamate N-acetyltransferase/amino-acid acetyltransferase ArgJ [Candidatus Halobeggiatoa sp. HSG11]